MEYYAKSPQMQGHQETIKEHLRKVAELAFEYGKPLGLGNVAALEGQVHDFGKYSIAFQDVLKGIRTGVDHAMGGACFLECLYKGQSGCHPLVEAVNGHHDGLRAYDEIKSELHAIAGVNELTYGNGGKSPAINSQKQLMEALAAFQKDFPEFKPPKLLPTPPPAELEAMLYTRMLFSCLVDADYTVSAAEEDSTYPECAQDDSFEPAQFLKRLYAYRDGIKRSSTAELTLNFYRDQVFEQCGKMGSEPEGVYTLTAPTGTGKTLAMLHFALQHCLKYGKKRIIVVLPFLTLAEQSAEIYSRIIPNVLVDHSQSSLPEEARELASKWSSPVIITTSVRFFESLFSDRPTVCRKLHNIANSVVLFDEAQSLPVNLISATLRTVNELCGRYHTTMVFSTATQPSFEARKNLSWTPREILPEYKSMFDALQRVDVQWRMETEIPLEAIAEEMAAQDSVCVIVNLRRHARRIAARLVQLCQSNTVFFLTTDLCPAHRSKQIETIRQRLQQKLPCRVVATQCIEAGVDLDFKMMYRALAPLEAIIQAAGRCNRNGCSCRGQVIVFRPEDSRMSYPDPWYNNAAVTVQEMEPPFSIHNPDTICEYYNRIFADTADKPELEYAIASRSFEQTAVQYKLVDNTGLRIVVPYNGEQERYKKAAKQMREQGITGALLKEVSPITVTTFAKNIELYAEEIPFGGRGKSYFDESTLKSGVYLLRPQFENLYSPELGMCFPQEEQSDFVF